MSTAIHVPGRRVQPMRAEVHEHPTLFFGSWGEDVKTLQQLLNRAVTPSPGLAEDGDFGARTELALIGFQAAHNLAADGIAGPMTWFALSPHHDDPRRRPRHAGPPPAPRLVPSFTGGHGCPRIVRRAGRNVPHFWQGDPRWAACAVGGGRSMACVGCAVTSMAMVMAYYGRKVDPGALNAFLGTSMINWSAACHFGGVNLGPVLRTEWHENARTRRARIQERIANGLPSIAHVDYKGDARGDHFVVVVGMAADGSLIMNDPASPKGNGALNWQDRDNRIETCRNRYRIVDLLAVDAV